MRRSEKATIVKKLVANHPLKREELFVRIDSLVWLKKIHLNEMDYLILNLKKSEWKELKWEAPFLRKNARKIQIELPKFIQEKDIAFYKDLCQKAMKNLCT